MANAKKTSREKRYSRVDLEKPSKEKGSPSTIEEERPTPTLKASIDKEEIPTIVSREGTSNRNEKFSNTG